MRFKLTLTVRKQTFGNVLPINYQYEQSAVIYRILLYK
jgi:CRISPR-associated endoribonuclease Cas6